MQDLQFFINCNIAPIAQLNYYIVRCLLYIYSMSRINILEKNLFDKRLIDNN